MFITRFFQGGERWDDRSWNKDYADSSREWDNNGTTNSRYRDRSYEDDYEAEREDSDTESNHNSYAASPPRKYRDSENNDSPTTSEKRVNLTLNSTAITKSPAKHNKVVKKVDLGAAANFGRSGTQSPTPQVSGDLLNDDFNPREGGNSNVEFGDFEKAFGGAEAKKDDDDFADFSSAFSAQPTQPPVNIATQPALLGTVQPSLIGGNLQQGLFGPPLSSPPQVNNNTDDLLGGLSSLSIQPQMGFGGSGTNSLLDGFDSG